MSTLNEMKEEIEVPSPVWLILERSLTCNQQ